VLLAAGGTLVARGGGLWFDELFTAQVSRLPLAEILRAGVRGQATVPYLDGIPPSYNLPYYLLTHLWLRLPGTGSDASLRLFTLLAAAVGVALLVRAVARIAGTPVGVLAGVAVAVNPLVVDQSVQARPYGLVLLATGAAALGLARWRAPAWAWPTGTRRRRWRGSSRRASSCARTGGAPCSGRVSSPQRR
jgi:4-amino-4-deoxy-L-arabinose transferase-like glycosyltransferase